MEVADIRCADNGYVVRVPRHDGEKREPTNMLEAMFGQQDYEFYVCKDWNEVMTLLAGKDPRANDALTRMMGAE